MAVDTERAAKSSESEEPDEAWEEKTENLGGLKQTFVSNDLTDIITYNP